MMSINAYPKSSGFLKTVGMGDWGIDFDSLSPENLAGIMTRAWDERDRLRAAMKPIVDAEKKKSRASVKLVTDILDSL